jgi:hypothetical protein
MSAVAPLLSIPVGVVLERGKTSGAWVEPVWKPVRILTGAPDTPAWTQLGGDEERATLYAGAADIELHRAETSNYHDNLATGAPLLWVALLPTGGEPPFNLGLVTADPAEAEAMAALGDDTIIDSIAMPTEIRDAVEAFVAEHHVERTFVKRKRDRANPESLGRRAPRRDESAS